MFVVDVPLITPVFAFVIIAPLPLLVIPVAPFEPADVAEIVPEFVSTKLEPLLTIAGAEYPPIAVIELIVPAFATERLLLPL